MIKEYLKKHYCIDCKTKEISYFSFRYGKGRCKSCASKGENNPNYKTGETLKPHYCIDCKIKEISMTSWKYGNYRCLQCHLKFNNGENHPNFKGGDKARECFCLDCKKLLNLHAYYGNDKRCHSCAAKNNWKISEKLKNMDVSGINNPMFGKITHGKGSYYNNIWMRSSYEIKFAQWCDKNEIQWSYESKTFDLGNATYTPDFYLPEFNIYIEIKGWWRDDAKLKFIEFKKRYCGEKIRVVDKEELQNLGII